MRIIVTENQFEKIMGVEGVPSDVLIEQVVAVASEQNTLTIFQQKINELISDPKKEKALMDNVSINLHKGKDTFILQIGNDKYPMKKTAQGMYAALVPMGKSITAAIIPMSSFAGEIEKIPEYKSLVEKHPEIKGQVQSGRIFSQIYSDNTHQGYFKLTVVGNLEDKKDEKIAVDVTKPYPLGEFFTRNKLIYKFPNGVYAILESSYVMADLISSRISINPPPQQVKQTYTAPINVQAMALADVFNFGDVSFKDEARTSQQIQSFVQQIKQFIEKHGTPFIEFFKAQNPTILGFSSIDGDPNQQIVGEYKPCSGNRTRKEYDLCLSTQRAKAIAEILNQELPELGGAFQSKGMGQTTKWGPGWTPENPTVPEQTAPNRRYVLNPIKPYVSQGAPVQTQ